ncbi:acyl-CoA dehydrogenase family protein [Streptomyces sp. DSM 44917]|uniref:Acyl-CoA dehydrogenase family protein n=1 Tax=Streptomyces boetiae TaxID=3075541 RepID=A0ABU2LF41_9ACTN|nr:acyl-CoA dehydrogenase family protein [Streptomyces sp. DSM 44917]MDT0310217.1 acyl-CoA dehydrogenase family protein [Streptomyces sp. DSM 44917]
MSATAQDARGSSGAAPPPGQGDPSFARELFLGRFRLGLVHPRPGAAPEGPPDPEDGLGADPGADLGSGTPPAGEDGGAADPAAEAERRGETFLARLRAFCADRIDGPAIDRAARVPDEVIAGLRELGAFGMRIAPEYGGLGLSHVHYHRALALAGSASPAVAALLSAHQSAGVPQPLALFGTEEQRRAYLPRCARGAISAFLLTEPDAGSDPGRLSATAVPDGEGGYLLDGVKLWATNGAIAELLLVLARVPGRGPTAFLVEADTPGVTVEHRSAFLGLRGIESAVTRFHRVRVPAGRRVGAEGAGLRIALTTLTAARLALPALCAGAGKWCLRTAREWSAARVQWGVPLAEHEAVAAKLSFIAATTFALEAVVELSGELADENRHDLRVEAALAKLYGSEMAWRIADELVQIRGGRGCETAGSLAARGERGVPAEQLLRDLRLHRVAEGSTEVMHRLVAREAVGAHLRFAGGLLDPDASLTRRRRAVAAAGAFYLRWLPSLATGRGQLPLAYGDFHVARHPDLAGHLRWAERTARRLARATFLGMSRWPGRLERRQRFLARIVDIGAELYAVTAACVHAERLRRAGEHGREAYALADAFCRQARLRVDDHFHHLWHNTDDADRALARELAEGGHAWLEDGVLDPSAPGPWIAETAAGPSTRKNCRRAAG